MKKPTEPAETSFFRQRGETAFEATPWVEGAWSREEQHIAPALGLLAHAIEDDARRRRGDPLALGRVSYDILGTIPIGSMEIEVSVVRPGRTIELVEARLSYGSRAVVLARGWLLQGFDTGPLAGSAFAPFPEPDELPVSGFDHVWPGACVRSFEVRRRKLGQGRAQAWMRSRVDLLDGRSVSATARALGMVDFANGLVPRVAPETALFPNVDLTVHLLRAPAGEWLGFDTSVSYGSGGIGLTHSVLHDADGPLGTVVQCLTVRPR